MTMKRKIDREKGSEKDRDRQKGKASRKTRER